MTRELIALLPLIIVGTTPLSVNAQQKLNSSTNYIHSEKASFKSKFFQKAAAIFNVKNLIEKKIVRKKYSQNVAPMPKSLRSNFKTTVNTIKGRKFWILKPKQNGSEKIILYLHGGAYYWNISKHNWAFAEGLLEKTNATFVIPDYPLAPHSTFEQAYEYLDELYEELISQHSPENITIMGESAGGGLALGFTMFLRNENRSQPNQLILMAPWLDVTMSNPEILKVDKKDKILGIKGLQLAGKGYAGENEMSNYKVSPINGDLTNLTEISLFVGTHDLFVADSRKLRDNAHSIGVTMKYYEYPKMFHVWILVNKLKEAKDARKQIISLILDNP